MGRDLGPDCRLCRREGEKLFLKGPAAIRINARCPVVNMLPASMV